MNNKKGRPIEYSTEQLKEILTDYAIKHVGKITYLGLEKETGIKRHVWSRRLKEEIDSLNNRVLNVNANNFEKITLPNVRDIVEKNWNNKESLISDLLVLNDYINSLWEKAIQQEVSEVSIQKLNETIQDLLAENTFLKKERDSLQEELNKKDILNHFENQEDAHRNSLQKIKEETNSWKQQFPNLFD